MTGTLQTAETILEQLGGSRFCAMTGARNFVGTDDSLRFSLPARLALHGINKVAVILEPCDLYRLEAYKLNRKTCELTHVETVSGIYAEDLRRTFKAVTGLDCTL